MTTQKFIQPCEQCLLVKVYLPNEIRRFQLSPKNSFQDFLQLLGFQKLYDFLGLMYLDDEEEWITFSTELEWQDAVRRGGDILRIKVIQKQPKKTKLHKMKRCKETVKKVEIPFFEMPLVK